MRNRRECHSADIMQDDEGLSAKGDAVMLALFENRIVAVCDPIILGEVVWVSTSFYQSSRQEVAEALLPIIKSDSFLLPSKDRYIRALELFAGPIEHLVMPALARLRLKTAMAGCSRSTVNSPASVE